MQDFLQPLEFYVFDIIANSHLSNPSYSFLTAYDVDKIGYIENPKFPYIIAMAGENVVDFKNNTATALLTVAIVAPFPESMPEEVGILKHYKANSAAAGYKRDLIEIAEWMLGKRKLTTNKKFLDFDGGENTLFNIDYDPILGDNDKLRTHENDPMGKLKRINKVLVVSMDITFTGDYRTLCCERFSPQDAGGKWAEVLAQF